MYLVLIGLVIFRCFCCYLLSTLVDFFGFESYRKWFLQSRFEIISHSKFQASPQYFLDLLKYFTRFTKYLQ